MYLTTYMDFESTWAEIKKSLDNQIMPYNIGAGDLIELRLKNGLMLSLEVAATNHYQPWEIVLVTRCAFPPLSARDSFDEIWDNSKIRGYLNGDFIKLLPDRFTRVLSYKTTGQLLADGSIVSSKDLIWIPTDCDMFGIKSHDNHQNAKQFQLYRNKRNRVKTLITEPSSYNRYWLISSEINTYHEAFCSVTPGGEISPTGDVSKKFGVVVGFLIQGNSKRGS